MKELMLAIIALSNDGYEVFISLDNRRSLSVVKDGVCCICVVRGATSDGARNFILKVRDIRNDVGIIAAVRPDTDEVWLIPAIDVEGLSTIRLGERWKHYKTVVKAAKSESTIDEFGKGIANLRLSAATAAKLAKESLGEK